MLALSSYKMKKYGECLFAVSKAATAIMKRDRIRGRDESGLLAVDAFGANFSRAD